MTERIDVSIVIPAFNEVKRLPLFLDRLISYCNSGKKVYEIIVVDDGSTDGTFETALSYRSGFPGLSVIKNEKNRGKGYSVKKGLLKARGEICMFLDADGAVGPEEIGKNIHYLIQEDYDVFIGSRVLKAKGQILVISWYRKFIGTIFNFLVHIFLFKGIKDTQCGFKMFKKESICSLFSNVQLEGFGFDIEILYLAHKLGYRVKEGPVSWCHVSGSRINLFSDSMKMFLNILQVRNIHHSLPASHRNRS